MFAMENKQDNLEKKLFSIGPVSIGLAKHTWKSLVGVMIETAIFYCVWEGCKYTSSEDQKPNNYYSQNLLKP